jgi:integrase
MLVLAYCAGLRVGEIARLRIGDVLEEEGAIDIRETKFYKSRRLPLAPGAMAALRAYLEMRRQDGSSADPEAMLFWHPRIGGHPEGGYTPASAAILLRRVLRHAGFNRTVRSPRARVHDLRHTFVVHRMVQWYREGINPQSRLAYLATYLGHRDIYSTLVYLTITQELLRSASERFRTLGAKALGPLISAD